MRIISGLLLYLLSAYQFPLFAQIYLSTNAAEAVSQRVYLNPSISKNKSVKFRSDLYYQKPYNLRELAQASLFLSIPVFNYRQNLSLSSYGDELYSEFEMHLFNNASLPFKNIFFTSNLGMVSLSIKNMDNRYSVSFSPGAAIKGEKYSAGFELRNVLSRGEHYLSNNIRGYKFSGNFRLNEQLLISTGVLKEEYFPAQWKMNMHFFIPESMVFNIGIGTNPDEYLFGCTVMIQKMRVHCDYTEHPSLGGTIGLGMSIILEG